MSEASSARDLAPESLFKFRPIDRPGLDRLKSLILEHRLWASSPVDFNDPYDCFPALDLQGSSKDRKGWAKRVVDRMNVGAPRALRRQKAREARHSIGNRQRLAEMAADSPGAWQRTAASIGIVSLAANATNLLMWSHYADSHKGVCLEYSTARGILGLAHRVTYSQDRPVFHPFDPDRSNLIERTLLIKALDWQYEEEWRVFVPRGGNTLIDIPPTALRSIILGAKVSVDDEQAIREIASVRAVPVEVRRAQLDTRTYKMNIVGS